MKKLLLPLLLFAALGMVAQPCTQSIGTFPYQEPFDTVSFSQCWNDSSSSPVYWRVNQGATASQQTGPANDHTYGNGWGSYAFMEASLGTLGDTGRLYMPTFDLSSLVNPEISFWYHMYGADMGNLFLEASTNGGATWSVIFAVSGQQQTSSQDPWIKATVVLSQYQSANTQFRFTGTRGNGFAGDMAIDDVNVGEGASCNAAFRMAQQSGTYSVTFLDSSWIPSNGVDSVSYYWHFGDGMSSTQVNPTHTYSSGGLYIPCLSITVHYANTDTCFSTYCDSLYLPVVTPTCNSSLSIVQDSTGSPLGYRFGGSLNVGSGQQYDSVITSYDYGDGNSTSFTGVGFGYHTYAAHGTYYPCVTHELFDNGVSVCSSSDCDTLSITAPNVSCNADFSYATDSVDPYLVHFGNLSSSTGLPSYAVVEYSWDYGDGVSGSMPYRTYASAGTYSVCLSAQVIDTVNQSVLCTDSICKQVTITGPTFCSAGYIVDTANSYAGTVYIWNTSAPAFSDPAYSSTYSWSFGDGSTSNQAFPVHAYAQPGMYDVCVTINSLDANQNLCSETFCDSLGVDSLGNLIYKSTNTGFTLRVLNPETIGLEEDNPFAAVEMYPNPADESVTLDLGGFAGNVQWTITDLKGAVVEKGSTSMKNKLEINVETLQSGIYILTLMNEEIPANHQKLVIDR